MLVFGAFAFVMGGGWIALDAYDDSPRRCSGDSYEPFLLDDSTSGRPVWGWTPPGRTCVPAEVHGRNGPSLIPAVLAGVGVIVILRRLRALWAFDRRRPSPVVP